MYPQHQRAHITLYLQLPRDMSEEQNPEQQKIHMVTFNFPAHKVVEQVECSLVTTESFESLPPSLINLDSLPKDFHLPQLGNGIEYHLIKFTSQDCTVSGGSLPKLLNNNIQEQVQTALSYALSSQRRDLMELTILVEGDRTLAFTETSNFNAAIKAEQKSDPLMAFYELTPRAKVLQLGNIIDFEARPDIPVQPAHLVFGDSMEYQVPHIMGATYEQEYQDFAINDYEGVQFESLWVELSAAKPDSDKPANAYLVYVRNGHFNLENLQHGDQVEVSLVEEFEEVTSQESSGGSNTDNNLSGQFATTITREEDELAGTLLRLKGFAPTTHKEDVIRNADSEAAEATFFETAKSDYGDDDSEPDQKPNVWHGVITSTVICPEGEFGIILERPRVQNWKGDKKDRPFITTQVPCITDRVTSIEELKEQIQANEQTVKIRIKPVQSRQAYKDNVRSITELFSSEKEDKRSLREYIQGRWDPTEPEQTTSLVKDMGPLNNIADFTQSQKDMYNSLGHIKRKIALVHGPFGTGKTGSIIKIIAKYLSNPEKRQQVLYVTGSNIGVDDAAMRCRRECEKYGIDKVIIRAHSLKGERAKLVKVKKGPSRFAANVPENIIQEFLALSYTTKVAKLHDERRRRGDPRRILECMSLTQAMQNYIEKHADVDKSLQSLRLSLTLIEERGPDRYDMDDVRMAINRLMELTLANADAIFCTTNTASKVNLYKNFQPGLIICDEACRSTEISTLSLFAFYCPDAWIFAGDHNQMRPIVLSADREKEHYKVRFQNTFYKQLLLSFMHRMLTIGHPVSFLAEQHRCDGGSSRLPSDMFYYGRVVDANKGKPYHPAVKAARKFTEALGLKEGSNMMVLSVHKSKSSKPEGSSSSINLDHVMATMKVVKQALEDKSLINKKGQLITVTITAMYKAQVALYEEHIEKLSSEDFKRRIAVRTVDAMQGYEDDFVILDMVRGYGVGFTGQRNRLTVALTRHILLLIIVMNTEMIPRSQEHPERIPAMRYLHKLILSHQNKHRIVTVEADSFACTLCCERGHMAKDCPQSKECYKCGQSGHTKLKCPNPGAPRNVRCYRCGEFGHAKQNCTNPKVPQCNGCSVFGHTKKDCPTVDKSTIKCNNCLKIGHLLRDCPLRGRKLGLKQCHEMKFGLNAKIEPGSDFITGQTAAQSQQPVNLDNSWAETVHTHGTLTQVSPKHDLNDSWMIAARPSASQDTDGEDWNGGNDKTRTQW